MLNQKNHTLKDMIKQNRESADFALKYSLLKKKLKTMITIAINVLK